MMFNNLSVCTMTDKEKRSVEQQYKLLRSSIQMFRSGLNGFRFGILPYDVEIAMSHLAESLVELDRLIEYHFFDPADFWLQGDVHESDSDPES